MDSIDGIRLDHFEPGHQYEVGTLLASVMLAEGWAVPVPDGQPALVVPFSETDSFAPREYHDNDAPANLTREHYPPYLNDRPEMAFDFERGKKPRK